MNMLKYIESFLKDVHSKMVQMADLFSVPEMCLLCNVTEFFEKNHIDYHPEIMFRDVKVLTRAEMCNHSLNIHFLSIIFLLSEFNCFISSDYAWYCIYKCKRIHRALSKFT